MLGMTPSTDRRRTISNASLRKLQPSARDDHHTAPMRGTPLGSIPNACACGGGCPTCQRNRSLSKPDDAFFMKKSGLNTESSSLNESEQSNEQSPVELYGHDEDCKQKDLEDHIWPADYLARKMLAKATKAVFRTPIHSKVKHQLWRYFDSRDPKGEELEKIQDTFVKLKVAFNASNYRYDCLEDSVFCDGAPAYTRELTGSTINLCMEEFRALPRSIKAGIIIHEMVHIRMKWRDKKYCRYAGDECEGCPADLMNTLENPDSYACFAEDVWPLDVD